MCVRVCRLFCVFYSGRANFIYIDLCVRLYVCCLHTRGADHRSIFANLGRSERALEARANRIDAMIVISIMIIMMSAPDRAATGAGKAAE